jgi:hypothetical protein
MDGVNFNSTTFYGHKDGCSYCGQPLTPNYSFCPFTEPMIQGCTREECVKGREEKKQKCVEIQKQIEGLRAQINQLKEQQKELGWVF